MQRVSHMAFAAGIGGLAGLGPHEFAAFSVGSIFPDMMDGFIAKGNQGIWWGVHRTVSHWPIFYPAVMALLVFSGADIPETVLRSVWAFLTGALVHISCDFLTPMGIPLYPPFKKRVSLKLIRTGSISDYAFGFFPGMVYGLVTMQQSL